MIISVEISYYPLNDNYKEAVNDFLRLLKESNLQIETGSMSTLIIGEYDDVFKMLNSGIKEIMIKYPSVFNIKISNSCEI